MDQTLDLDISWNPDEIIAQSPNLRTDCGDDIEELIETQVMFNNLQINYKKCTEKSKE